ncbi:MAG: TetR family transcriptional regulator [Hansschlegelia sp.]
MSAAPNATRGQTRYRAGSSDTREEIVAVSERLFRTAGYRKTTIADVAAALGMSPANVYRFFESKAAINEAVAERVLQGMTDELAAVAARTDLAPRDRLRRLLLDWADLSVAEFMADQRMHDMVEAAMSECWRVCAAYGSRMEGVIAIVISDGIASGAFAVADVEITARCVKAAMLRFVDPAIMSRNEPGPKPEEMVALLLASLGAA